MNFFKGVRVGWGFRGIFKLAGEAYFGCLTLKNYKVWFFHEGLGFPTPSRYAYDSYWTFIFFKKKPLVKYLHFKALKFVRTKYADKDTKVHILSRHALTWSVKHKIFRILEFYIKTKYVHIYKKKKKMKLERVHAAQVPVSVSSVEFVLQPR